MQNKKIILDSIVYTISALSVAYICYQGFYNAFDYLLSYNNTPYILEVPAHKIPKDSSEAKIETDKATPAVAKRDVEAYVKTIKVNIKKLENSVAYKSNNPGNLVYAGQPNAKPMKFADKTFASYATPELGFRALIKQIEVDQIRELTLASFVNKYAPAHENDTNKYIAFAVEKLNSHEKENIKNLDSIELAKTMAEFESQTTVIE